MEASKKLLILIEKYRIYLIIPVLIIINHIITCNRYLGFFIGEGIDLRAFYFGIRNSFFDPQNAYFDTFYFDNGAYPFTYQPFFSLLFFPLTLWGIEVFAVLFFYIGLILLFVSIVIWDYLMQERKIGCLNRTFYLILMTLGNQYYWVILYNQSKFYTLFAITLIIYGDIKNWNSIIIHILFIFLISIMTHLFFFYIYYILYQARRNAEEKERFKLKKKRKSGRNQRYQNEKITNFIVELTKNSLIALGLFIMANILFLVNYELIGGYFDFIFGNFLSREIFIGTNVKNTIIPYLFRTYLGINDGLFTILIIVSIFAVLLMFLYDFSILGAGAINCLIMFVFNPYNSSHYFVFIFPTIFLFIAHDFKYERRILYIFDLCIHFLFLGVVIFHIREGKELAGFFLHSLFLILVILDLIIIKYKKSSL